MRVRRWLGAVRLVLLLAAAGFVVWGSTPAGPMPEALAALNSDERVVVQARDDVLIFTPTSGLAKAGLIFYPGGRVDFRAYAPAARAIAKQGYRVEIPKMPLNLAVFGANRAEDIIRANPDVGVWVIGGHSLGGAMAAHYARQHPGAIHGLLLWASYPSEGDDLSQMDLKVASVYGTRDGVAEPERVTAAAVLLPENTRWVTIEGGNHAGFGWYGVQAGDQTAAISRQAQQDQAVQAALELLEQVEEAGTAPEG